MFAVSDVRFFFFFFFFNIMIQITTICNKLELVQ